MRLLPSLPWKAHCLFAVLFPLLFAVPPYVAYGVAQNGYAIEARFASTGWFVAAWIVAVPLIFAETNAVKRGYRGGSLVSAALAHAALAFVGTLPFTLSWALSGFGTQPIDYDWVRISIATYAVLLGGYFVALVLIGLFGHVGPSSRNGL